MSTRVTLTFVTDESAKVLQKFLEDVAYRNMLNSNDNEEGVMIDFRDFQYEIREAL